MPLLDRKMRKWTPEMERELWNLWNYGVHRNEIAERMGLTVAAVEGRYYVLKKMKEQTDVKVAAE
jgi:DNA-binding transcriptional regulator LsrR (DeoR family)